MKTATKNKYEAIVEADGFCIELRSEQDYRRVRGNATASGDTKLDREVEEEIISRLDDGDHWAWAIVAVNITHPSFPFIEGRDSLGCCSYADEDDFKQQSGYYDDMLYTALQEWIRAAREAMSVDWPALIATAESLSNRLAE